MWESVYLNGTCEKSHWERRCDNCWQMPQRKEEQKLAPTNDAIHFLLYLAYWRYKASAILPSLNLWRVFTRQKCPPWEASLPLRSSRAFRTRVHCVRACWEYIRACTGGKTVDIKRAYRTWNPRGFPRDEKLMARQLSKRCYNFGWWLVTPPPSPPLALNICHLFIIENS